MAGEFVSWQDYSAGGGISPQYGDNLIGGMSNGEDLQALQKALTAGSDINNPGGSAGEGFPLRVESLDSTLYNVTYKAQDVKFWKSLYKDAAYNTVEEFNRLHSYGSGNSIFMSEGSLPSEDDSTYERAYTKVKFMGTVRRCTHVMSLLRAAHGDVVARETVNGTMFLLRQIERTLFDGNEDLLPVQFNGIERELVGAWGSNVLDDGMLSGYEDDNVIDMRGQPLSEDHIADMVERLVAEPNYGQPSDLWLPTGPVKDLSKILYPKERYDLPAPRGGMAGISIKGITTPFGDINLNPDIFIPRSDLAPTTAVGSAAQRPGAPTVGAPAAGSYGGSDTNYWGASDAGAYTYQIVACNQYGKAIAVDSAAVTVASGDSVSITVTNGSDTSYYEIYRTAAGGAAATARLIFKVAAGTVTTSIVDLNRFLPNTSKGYMLTQSSEVLKWKQLAPFTKIPLATIDTSVRWMQVLYGALQVMAPKKNGIFINVGNLATGAYS
tara:strand:- start:96 stop:1580 length:1485 start_codon:yes stop_codon:yes gene_type:complete